MKKFLLFILATVFSLPLFSQHQADKWYFGVLAGLDFTNGSPVAFSGSAIYTNEGCSAISDSNGVALFYTDGITVWNSSNQAMPNGTGLMGGLSATQSALIVPDPADNHLYYIFTVDEIGGPNGFRYSKVDMSLQGGLGDVTVSNVLLQDSVTERLTTVQNDATWIAVHGWGTNGFYLYRLTSGGLTTTPVISNAGIVHTRDSIQYTYGQMKFSPCGDKIAVAVGYLDTVEVFDFDGTTGIVSNPVTLPMADHVYGLEFSDDATKLYVSSYDPNGTLLQYNLSAGNTAAVIASRTVLGGVPYTYGLQIGNDQKIYVCKSFSTWLGVINDPSLSGLACNYVDSGVNLDPLFLGSSSALSLPGFVQSYFKTNHSCVVTGTDELKSTEENILYPNPSTEEFTLKLSKENSFYDILISDQTGKLISQHFFKSPELKFSFGKSFASGIYFVRIKGDGIVNMLKAVKISE